MTISQVPKNDNEAIAYLAVLNGEYTHGQPLYKDAPAVYVERIITPDHKQAVALRWRWVGWNPFPLLYEVEPW